jgi:hypothetical protein
MFLACKAVGCGEFGRVSRDELVLDRDARARKAARWPPAGKSASRLGGEKESLPGGQAELCGLHSL